MVKVRAKRGHKVKVHYTGRLKDGTQFASTENQDPIELTIGEGKMPRAFEHAVIGMEPGETKTRIISVSEAYGPHKDELVFRVSRPQILPRTDLKPGKRLTVQLADGSRRRASIVEVFESNVILDANHPLAGRDLTFQIELVEILP